FQACTTDDVQPIGGSGAAIVSISVDKSAIFEDAGKAVLTASLSTNTTEDVTISLRFTGTATISADYSATNTMVISAGSLTATMDITALQDTDQEGNETIVIEISNAIGASIAANQPLAIIIEDDDVAQQIQLIFNEVLYDPSNSGLDGDANGDGSYAQNEDEFIELINLSSQNLDMSGYTIFDDENLAINSPNHTIPNGTILAPGKALVIFGGGTPTGSFGGATVQTSTSGDLNMNNAGDKVTVKDASGNVIVTFDIEPLSNNPNESYTRNPDLTGDFEQHTTNTSKLFSPGTKIDGSPF
ncbi:MAG: hypothetical protein RLZZ337_59, partial [Bacteroidota bacterium]